MLENWTEYALTNKTDSHAQYSNGRGIQLPDTKLSGLRLSCVQILPILSFTWDIVITVLAISLKHEVIGLLCMVKYH